MLDRSAVFIKRKAFRAESHALVEFDVVADVAGFANDNAGAVVDKESFADAGAGVDGALGSQHGRRGRRTGVHPG